MPSRGFNLALLIAAGLSLVLLPGCSTVSQVTAAATGKEGVSTDQAARYIPPEDPIARPVQVAWTSARASQCGFMFDPARLKADYLADEARRGVAPDQLQKLAKAYDYTLDSVAATIRDDPNYCSRERTDAIRADLKRYLAGDYAPKAKLAR